VGQKSNIQIRDLAQRERALLVDVGAAFFNKDPIQAIANDHVHPNRAGYALMADTFFRAPTQGTTGSASGSMDQPVDLVGLER
jgi:hypothetical protein